MDLPQPPVGSGAHPVSLIVISAADLGASSAFYTTVFGWQLTKMSEALTAAVAPGGPAIALRSGMPAGFPGLVPFLHVDDVTTALERVVAAGGTVERAPWTLPQIGTLARFADPSGTIYGVTSGGAQVKPAPVPMPFGANPKPPVNSICSLEMYSNGEANPNFFTTVFGFGTLPTMPAFVAFDVGSGIGGVFQAHTPGLRAVAYIYVADVAATLLAIEAAGGARLGDAMAMPGMGTFGYFTDPSSTTMGLIGP